MAIKNKAVVNKDRCVACGACVKACPRAALTVIRGCYAESDLPLCVGCGLCARTCPAACIEISKREEG